MPKKKSRKEEAGTEASRAPKVSIASQVDLTPEILRRFERDIKKGAFDVLTPYTLAQAYNIRMSVARKLLREAAKKKLVVQYSGGRTPIYITIQTTS